MSLRGLILTSNMGLPVLLFCHFCISNVDSYYLFVFLSVRFDLYQRHKESFKREPENRQKTELNQKKCKESSYVHPPIPTNTHTALTQSLTHTVFFSIHHKTVTFTHFS